MFRFFGNVSEEAGLFQRQGKQNRDFKEFLIAIFCLRKNLGLVRFKIE